MSEETKRVLYAIAYAAGLALTILGTAGEPHGILAWLGFVGGAIITGYGKYSTSTKLLGPNRDVWTTERRMEDLGSVGQKTLDRLKGSE